MKAILNNIKSALIFCFLYLEWQVVMYIRAGLQGLGQLIYSSFNGVFASALEEP